ncbi:hypothetical protein pb186bvf_003882 [Paramecium bursaria]
MRFFIEASEKPQQIPYSCILRKTMLRIQINDIFVFRNQRVLQTVSPQHSSMVEAFLILNFSGAIYTDSQKKVLISKVLSVFSVIQQLGVISNIWELIPKGQIISQNENYIQGIYYDIQNSYFFFSRDDENCNYRDQITIYSLNNKVEISSTQFFLNQKFKRSVSFASNSSPVRRQTIANSNYEVDKIIQSITMIRDDRRSPNGNRNFIDSGNYLV